MTCSGAHAVQSASPSLAAGASDEKWRQNVLVKFSDLDFHLFEAHSFLRASYALGKLFASQNRNVREKYPSIFLRQIYAIVYITVVMEI